MKDSDPKGRSALGKYEEGGEDRGPGGRMETVTFDMRPRDMRKSLRCNTSRHLMMREQIMQLLEEETSVKESTTQRGPAA